MLNKDKEDYSICSTKCRAQTDSQEFTLQNIKTTTSYDKFSQSAEFTSRIEGGLYNPRHDMKITLGQIA